MIKECSTINICFESGIIITALLSKFSKKGVFKWCIKGGSQPSATICTTGFYYEQSEPLGVAISYILPVPSFEIRAKALLTSNKLIMSIIVDGAVSKYGPVV